MACLSGTVNTMVADDRATQKDASVAQGHKTCQDTAAYPFSSHQISSLLDRWIPLTNDQQYGKHSDAMTFSCGVHWQTSSRDWSSAT